MLGQKGARSTAAVFGRGSFVKLSQTMGGGMLPMVEVLLVHEILSKQHSKKYDYPSDSLPENTGKERNDTFRICVPETLVGTFRL